MNRNPFIKHKDGKWYLHRDERRSHHDGELYTFSGDLIAFRGKDNLLNAIRQKYKIEDHKDAKIDLEQCFNNHWCITIDFIDSGLEAQFILRNNI